MGWEGQERRQFPRAEFPCKITLGSPLRLFTSHTENISEGGIRAFLEDKLNPFINVSVELYVDREHSLKCKGKVMWVVEKINPAIGRPTLYDTGIKFVDMSEVDRVFIRDMVRRLTQSAKTNS